ncbi:hypothetical protein [Mucilaginibacter celer]|uniref:Uncharacterized protein n=1 Tax=Mucilaginibacter celer TaxID=2305508 RepID=A0A494VQ22_9SPHI|nr:hypothetical protein [Mucilaginibacter celer]AYL97606.1 hypothetical protein HYN43_020940 [Mucilaginibacter celer]
MILSIPETRVCEGRETRYPVTNFNPVLWIKTDNATYSVINIDGFIVTAENAVNGLFKKLEYREETPDEDITLENITQLISENELRLIMQLSGVLQCRFFTFLWPENYPIGYDPADEIIHSFSFADTETGVTIATHKKLNLSAMQEGIKRLRRRSFDRPKNMKAATSNLECYLANETQNPWPGDIDAMIYSHATGRFEAIIEFKTHNADKPIENEAFGNYPEDWRRFDVLFDLVDNFDARLGYRPKLLFIVWGTNGTSANHANIKIDLIERGRVINTLLFPRPPYNVFSDGLFNFLMQIINAA